LTLDTADECIEDGIDEGIDECILECPLDLTEEAALLDFADETATIRNNPSIEIYHLISQMKQPHLTSDSKQEPKSARKNVQQKKEQAKNDRQKSEQKNDPQNFWGQK